jgi:hypothetical protein
MLSRRRGDRLGQVTESEIIGHSEIGGRAEKLRFFRLPLSLEEVAAAMFSLCDWCDSPPFVDFDKLMSIGMWVRFRSARTKTLLAREQR